MSKVKVSDKFQFPLELDLGAYLPPELAADSAQYDLTAILIHKGTSASHGHYGALPLLPAPALCCTIFSSTALNIFKSQVNSSIPDIASRACIYFSVTNCKRKAYYTIPR